MALRLIMTGKAQIGLLKATMRTSEPAIPMGGAFVFIAALLRIFASKIARVHKELNEHLLL